MNDGSYTISSQLGRIEIGIQAGRIVSISFAENDTPSASQTLLSAEVVDRFNIERLLSGCADLVGMLDFGNCTPFQRAVWQAVAGIQPGTTITYGELARRVGCPGGARAVARALASNRLALIVPCHRVVHSDGSPSGYKWGAERKKALLEFEKNHFGR